LKTLNTHIHVLEALVELYGVRREALVRARLEETLALVRDRMTVPPGALNFYFTADWRALPMHDSFGHDVEAAYLMQCAADLLGGEEAAHTARVARGVVDHALDWGWDGEHGGLWFAGQAFGPPFDRTKSWWVQAESLNALLVMHERYGHETDRYWTAFLAQLRFVWNRLVDHRHGGWFPRATEDGSALVGTRDKAMPWKAAYHDGRALMNAVEALRRMAAA
jgi:mannobiose 2-epimerase